MYSSDLLSADVVITAGATREPIDNVRFISNFSTGKLGHALAKTYSEKGRSVVLLAPRLTMRLYGPLPGVTHIPFDNASDLAHALGGIESARLVLHTAAVSDYTFTKRVNGKISSDQETLHLELDKTKKILAGLREQFGPDTTLVGFKLLSEVPEDHLIEVARKQIEDNGTDFCVANLLEDIRDERRVHVVQRDGSYRTLTGSATEIAVGLTEAIQINPTEISGIAIGH